MTNTLHHPRAANSKTRAVTLGELADNFHSLKPVRGNLRVSFPYLRFQPTGILRSAVRGAGGGVEVTLSLDALHRRRFVFQDDTECTPETICNIWGPADEQLSEGSLHRKQ